MKHIDPAPAEIEKALLTTIATTRGHCRYESDHHGNLWLDLNRLFVDVRRAHGWAAVLAQRAAVCQPELVCGR